MMRIRERCAEWTIVRARRTAVGIAMANNAKSKQWFSILRESYRFTEGSESREKCEQIKKREDKTETEY